MLRAPWLGLWLLAWLAPSPAHGLELTPSEERGRVIYSSGVSPSGRAIRARVGENRLELPGDAVPCGSCHGEDGTGRPESGVLPSNIAWTHLTRSYGHRHTDGLEHAAFGPESLARFIKTGVYPGGSRGDASMPVFEMSDADLGDLIAYLKRVGELADPGIGATSLRIGSLVPTRGPLGEIGAAIRGVLEAYFSELNAAGGIYGREIELVVGDAPRDGVSSMRALEAWLAREEPFALVSPFTPGLDTMVQSTLSSAGVPVIGPFSLYSIGSYEHNRNVFYLFPGLREQLEALIAHTASGLQERTVSAAVLYADERSLDDVIDAIDRATTRRGWQALGRRPFEARRFDAAGAVDALRAADTDVVVFLGAEPELGRFLTKAAEREWFPYVLAAGALSGRALASAPTGFGERLHLGYPSLPQDRMPWAMEEIHRLLGDRPDARSHTQAVVSAYAAAKVLVEGLRRTGRNLRRARLTREVEHMYEFETGVTRPVSFTENRRVGARGAYVVAPDSLVDGRPSGPALWVDVD